MLRYLLILAVATLSPSARSQTAIEMYQWCNSTADIQKSYCIGYLSGSLDAYGISKFVTKSERLICLPEGGLNNEQALLIFSKAVRDEPKDAGETARVFFYRALNKAFPCARS